MPKTKAIKTKIVKADAATSKDERLIKKWKGKKWSDIITIKWSDKKAKEVADQFILNCRITGMSPLSKIDVKSLKFSTDANTDSLKVLNCYYKKVLQEMNSKDFFKDNKVLFKYSTYEKLKSEFFTIEEAESDEIKNAKSELFRAAIAIRILIEIRKNKMAYPYHPTSEAEALASFKKLQSFSITYGTDATQITHAKTHEDGVWCSSRFSDPLIHATKNACFDSHSALDGWETNNLLLKEIKGLLKLMVDGKRNTDLDNTALRLQLKLSYQASDYQPVVVLQTLAAIKAHYPNFVCTSVIDPCGGFGGRLVGYLAHSQITTVYINDANKKLRTVYEQINALYNPEKTKSVRMSFKAAETLEDNEIAPNKEKYDLMLTGWPFFRKELYEGANQSTTVYQELDTWREGFLYKTCKSIRKHINLGGFIVSTLQDYKAHDTISKKYADKGVIHLVNPLIKFFTDNAATHGFEFVKTMSQGKSVIKLPIQIVIVRAVNIVVSPEKVLAIGPPVNLPKPTALKSVPRKKRKFDANVVPTAVPAATAPATDTDTDAVVNKKIKVKDTSKPKPKKVSAAPPKTTMVNPYARTFFAASPQSKTTSLPSIRSAATVSMLS